MGNLFSSSSKRTRVDSSIITNPAAPRKFVSRVAPYTKRYGRRTIKQPLPQKTTSDTVPRKSPQGSSRNSSTTQDPRNNPSPPQNPTSATESLESPQGSSGNSSTTQGSHTNNNQSQPPTNNTNGNNEFPSLYARPPPVTPTVSTPLKQNGNIRLALFGYTQPPPGTVSVVPQWNYGRPLPVSTRQRIIAEKAIAEEEKQRAAQRAAEELNRERAAANALAKQHILAENSKGNSTLFNSLQGRGGRRTKKRNRNHNRKPRPTHTSA
jgi:hypothetical protein